MNNKNRIGQQDCDRCGKWVTEGDLFHDEDSGDAICDSCVSSGKVEEVVEEVWASRKTANGNTAFYIVGKHAAREVNQNWADKKTANGNVIMKRA